MTEDFCGVTQDVSERETSAGTAYRLCKWSCQFCKKACCRVEIDGEHCGGDVLVISHKDGERRVMCGACWLL